MILKIPVALMFAGLLAGAILDSTAVSVAALAFGAGASVAFFCVVAERGRRR